jgi:hypothetical protein
VAAFGWNGWQACRGISGRLGLEYSPMPENLKMIDTALRKMGMGKYADDFTLTLNRAAEKSAKEVIPILAGSIKDMSFSDGMAILNGPENSATSYFKNNTSGEIQEKIKPIILGATDSAGVTKAYKLMLKQLGSYTQYVKPEKFDIDQYVSEKTTNGIFIMMAKEEKKIREEPIARTTELMKKIFQ